ncbi:response regulator receiver sensor signal transduction histidine kinase [Candidatus Magnetobacterium bavaricum]|uniref:histidine kinase n=1 Tax=Candidatus Magnetobacterium bavaricum TaxID=29290 RepID=A0A0F3GZM5_9BACT|nr:response regulator receiver sensor signal transduction histidine kinase [Candidatus Magnetobacterium bavaricum]
MSEDLEKQKILIVDDEISNIKITNEILRADYMTYFATNARDALDTAFSTIPDLILLDVVMPDVDGYELCRRLKNEPSLAHVPVIFVTSMSSRDDETIGLELGAVDYIHKPIKPAILKLRVANHLALRRQMFQEELLTQQLIDSNAQLLHENIERRRVEKILELRNHQLKQRQEQLVQSEKMRSLGQLVAGVAHEINNPLSFLISNMNNLMKFVNSYVELIEAFHSFDIPEKDRTTLEMLKEEIFYDRLKVRTKEIIERAKVGLGRIQQIVLDLKAFSRMDRAEILETDINESIAVTLALLTHEFSDRIKVVTDYGDIPLIKCYSSELNQVFMNILRNSGQAVDGKGEIKIKTTQEHSMIRIDISDTGTGIPLEIRDKIFDPFFTTKPVGIGTGLGLSTSLGIIKKHNGEIAVESTEGNGSTFTIKLPIANECLK